MSLDAGPVSSRRYADKMNFTEWRALILLVLSVGINYIDRGSLSIAAPILQKELGLTAAQLGLLLSAFFWTYASFQLISGWLVDRFPVNWVFGIGFLIWSGATAATGMASTLLMLLALRVLLGAGESVAYPAYSKIITTGFPEKQRGVTNALIDAGSKIGPALGTLIGGLLVAQYGWRCLFYVLGIGSVLWLIPWSAWSPKSPPRVSGTVHGGPSFGAILRKRSAWGSFFLQFCMNYAWYFLLTWLPTYLVDARHFTMSQMAVLASVPLWGLAATTAASGWATDWLIRKGHTPTVVRKGFAVAGMLLLCVTLLPSVFVQNPTACVALIVVGCLSFGLSSANHWAIAQTLSGPLAAGRWTGAQNAFGNMAGVVAPALTGLIVSQTGSFHYAFVMVGVFLVFGSFSVLFIIGPIEQVSWDDGDNRVLSAEPVV